MAKTRKMAQNVLLCRKTAKWGMDMEKSRSYRAAEAMVRSMGVTCANLSMR